MLPGESLLTSDYPCASAPSTEGLLAHLLSASHQRLLVLNGEVIPHDVRQFIPLSDGDLKCTLQGDEDPQVVPVLKGLQYTMKLKRVFGDGDTTVTGVLAQW